MFLDPTSGILDTKIAMDISNTAPESDPVALTILPTARSKIVDNIEHKTGKQVVIDTLETGDVLTKCHPQDQSPLFTQLPREMRDLIWAFATAPMEDKYHAYKTNEFYYRPGHVARLKTDYNLLLTCRRAWLEAHALPMLQAEHSFWYERAAPDARSKEWMAGLTASNRKDFGTLHLYAQMTYIEPLSAQAGALKEYFLPSHENTDDFQPLKFHVTIRHTDWWWWEHERPLRLEYEWVQAQLDSPDLRRTETLKLELETLDYKVVQLNPIVEHIRRMESKEYETHVVGGQPTKTKFLLTGEPEVTSWTGPTNLDGKTYDPYEKKEKLNYHVVTLTWRLQFPQCPEAHIPRLRLAPQMVHKTPSHPASTPSSTNIAARSDADQDLSTDWPERDPFFTVRFPFASPGHYKYGSLWSSGPIGIRRPMFSWTPPSAKIEHAMHDASDHAQGVQELQARVGEYFRRRQFWRSMKPIWNEHWRKKFAAEKSLLRLEEVQQE